MNLKTRILVCTVCGEEFVFTAEAQQYFTERRTDDPKRCKYCHLNYRKSLRQEMRRNAVHC